MILEQLRLQDKNEGFMTACSAIRLCGTIQQWYLAKILKHKLLRWPASAKTRTANAN